MPGNYEMSDISRILNILLRDWDRCVENYGAAAVDSSVLSQDMIIGRRLGWSEATVQTTRTVSFLIGSSVVQMARSVSALFENTEKYGLTFGHVPLARSIYEGAGQVKWILADDDDLYADAVLALEVEESERRCRRRGARGILTTAANWQQCLADARFQKDEAMEADALERLEELETRAGSEVAEISKSKDNTWWMLGISRPGARRRWVFHDRCSQHRWLLRILSRSRGVVRRLETGKHGSAECCAPWRQATRNAVDSCQRKLAPSPPGWYLPANRTIE